MDMGLRKSILHLYFNDPPVRARPPDLKRLRAFPLTGFRFLPVIVNGHKVSMYVDSGTTASIILHKTAKKLDLLDQIDTFQRFKINLWNSKKRVKAGVIWKVLVRLQENENIKMFLTVRILPADMDNYYKHENHLFMFDSDSLSRFKVIQTFGKVGSSLYFKNSKIFCYSEKGVNRKHPNDLFETKVNARRDRKDPPLKLIIDTGSEGLNMSKNAYNSRIKPYIDKHGYPIPHLIKLHLGGEDWIATPVSIQNNLFSDFVMGRRVFT